MKYPILLAVAILLAISATAQKFELKINAGANLTHVSDFQNQVYVADGFVIPGFLNYNNARNGLSAVGEASQVKSGIGFNAELEAGWKFNKTWKLSVAAGIMQLKHDYDFYIANSFYKNNFYLSEATSKYGNTSLTYLSVRPLNVAVTFNRFSVQGGAVLDFLTGKKYNNTVIIYNTTTGEALGGFFEMRGDARKLLYGAHLNARFAVIKNLEVMLAGQYFFNTLYKDEDTPFALYAKSKVWQAQLGLSYNLAPLFRR